MRRIFLVLLIVITSGFHQSVICGENAHKYVGAKFCGMCHKSEASGKQFVIWEKSKHASAFKTLTTPEADKIAKEKGYSTKAAETEACLKCHATGYNADASLLSDKFNVSDGVQCETCHGPGSDYKTKKIMEDKKLAIDNGLKVYENIEEMCVKCHNEESPFFKGFNFKEKWAQIEHSKNK